MPYGVLEVDIYGRYDALFNAMDRVDERLRATVNRPWTIKPTLDTSGLSAQVTAVKQVLAGIGSVVARVEVEVDGVKLGSEQFQNLAEAGKRAKNEVKRDMQDLVQIVHRNVEEIDKSAKIRITVDTKDFDDEMLLVTARKLQMSKTLAPNASPEAITGDLRGLNKSYVKQGIDVSAIEAAIPRLEEVLSLEENIGHARTLDFEVVVNKDGEAQLKNLLLTIDGIEKAATVAEQRLANIHLAGFADENEFARFQASVESATRFSIEQFKEIEANAPFRAVGFEDEEAFLRFKSEVDSATKYAIEQFKLIEANAPFKRAGFADEAEFARFKNDTSSTEKFYTKRYAQYDKVADEYGGVRGITPAQAEEVRQLENALRRSKVGTDAFNSALERAKLLISEMGAAGTQAGDAIAKRLTLATEGLEQVGERTRRARNDVFNLHQSFGEMVNTIRRFVVGYFAVSGLMHVFRLLKETTIDYNSVLQRTGVALTAMFNGNRAAAQSLLVKLQDFAIVTPFRFVNLVPFVSQLTTAGVIAQRIIPTLRALGDAASASGKEIDVSVERMVTDLISMSARGKVTGEDIRAFGHNGVNIVKYLAEAYHDKLPQGTERAQMAMREMIHKGLIPAGDAINAIVKGIENDPLKAGQMEKQSHTFAGAVSNIWDAINKVFGNATRDSFNRLTDAANNLLVILSKPAFEQAVVRLMGKIEDGAIGGYKAVYQLYSYVRDTTPIVTATIIGLTFALAKNPLFAAVSLAAGLALALNNFRALDAKAKILTITILALGAAWAYVKVQAELAAVAEGVAVAMAGGKAAIVAEELAGTALASARLALAFQWLVKAGAAVGVFFAELSLVARGGGVGLALQFMIEKLGSVTESMGVLASVALYLLPVMAIAWGIAATATEKYQEALGKVTAANADIEASQTRTNRVLGEMARVTQFHPEASNAVLDLKEKYDKLKGSLEGLQKFRNVELPAFDKKISLMTDLKPFEKTLLDDARRKLQEQADGESIKFNVKLAADKEASNGWWANFKLGFQEMYGDTEKWISNVFGATFQRILYTLPAYWVVLLGVYIVQHWNDTITMISDAWGGFWKRWGALAEATINAATFGMYGLAKTAGGWVAGQVSSGYKSLTDWTYGRGSYSPATGPELAGNMTDGERQRQNLAHLGLINQSGASMSPQDKAQLDAANKQSADLKKAQDDLTKYSNSINNAPPTSPGTLAGNGNKAANAAKKLNEDKLRDSAQLYDEMAKQAEASAKRQIDAIRSVTEKLHDLFGGAQEELLKLGVINDPLGPLIARFTELTGLEPKMRELATSTMAVAEGYRKQGAEARGKLNKLQGGDGETPAADLKASKHNSTLAAAAGRGEHIRAITDWSNAALLEVANSFASGSPKLSCAHVASRMAEAMGESIGTSDSAGTLRERAQKYWQRVTDGNIQRGDLVFNSREGGSGYHVKTGIGPGMVLNSNHRQQDIYHQAHGDEVYRYAGRGAGMGAGSQPDDLLGQLEIVRKELKAKEFVEVPESWGAAVKSTEDNTFRFKAQILLANREFVEFMRSVKGADFEPWVRELRRAANETDITVNHYRALSVSMEQMKDIWRSIRLVGHENDPLAQLNEELTEGKLRALEANEKVMRVSQTVRLITAQSAQATKEFIRDENEKARALSAGAPYLKAATFNAHEYERAIAMTTERIKVYRDLENQMRADRLSGGNAGEVEAQRRMVAFSAGYDLSHAESVQKEMSAAMQELRDKKEGQLKELASMAGPRKMSEVEAAVNLNEKAGKMQRDLLASVDRQFPHEHADARKIYDVNYRETNKFQFPVDQVPGARHMINQQEGEFNDAFDGMVKEWQKHIKEANQQIGEFKILIHDVEQTTTKLNAQRGVRQFFLSADEQMKANQRARAILAQFGPDADAGTLAKELSDWEKKFRSDYPKTTEIEHNPLAKNFGEIKSTEGEEDWKKRIDFVKAYNREIEVLRDNLDTSGVTAYDGAIDALDRRMLALGDSTGTASRMMDIWSDRAIKGMDDAQKLALSLREMDTQFAEQTNKLDAEAQGAFMRTDWQRLALEQERTAKAVGDSLDDMFMRGNLSLDEYMAEWDKFAAHQAGILAATEKTEAAKVAGTANNALIDRAYQMKQENEQRDIEVKQRVALTPLQLAELQWKYEDIQLLAKYPHYAQAYINGLKGQRDAIRELYAAQQQLDVQKQMADLDDKLDSLQYSGTRRYGDTQSDRDKYSRLRELQRQVDAGGMSAKDAQAIVEKEEAIRKAEDAERRMNEIGQSISGIFDKSIDDAVKSTDRGFHKIGDIVHSSFDGIANMYYDLSRKIIANKLTELFLNATGLGGLLSRMKDSADAGPQLGKRKGLPDGGAIVDRWGVLPAGGITGEPNLAGEGNAAAQDAVAAATQTASAGLDTLAGAATGASASYDTATASIYNLGGAADAAAAALANIAGGGAGGGLGGFMNYFPLGGGGGGVGGDAGGALATNVGDGLDGIAGTLNDGLSKFGDTSLLVHNAMLNAQAGAASNAQAPTYPVDNSGIGGGAGDAYHFHNAQFVFPNVTTKDDAAGLHEQLGSKAKGHASPPSRRSVAQTGAALTAYGKRNNTSGQ